MRESGRRLCIVIVAEGAQDEHGIPITSNQVKDVCISDLLYNNNFKNDFLVVESFLAGKRPYLLGISSLPF